MTKKLLKKTTNSFLALAVIILLISAPVFYFICQWLYVYETDEVLLFHKGAFEKESRNNFTEKDIAAWNKHNRDVEIVADMGVTKDSIIGEMLFDSIANEKEPFRILYAPVTISGKQFTYIEKTNLVEMEGMIFSIAVMFLCIIAILLTGIIWLSKRSSARIWKPFYDTLKQIQNFEIDKNNPPHFIPTDIDEFERLNKSLERLIEKNVAIYKNQREFIENAAHELQTPLALFQSKIDILIQAEGLSKDQSKLLNALNNDVSRLNRLNKNLLMLSKIDNELYENKQAIVLNECLTKNFDFFKEQAKAKNISIVTHCTNNASIMANPVLIEVLINNLFLNAIRHNHQDGTIIITMDNDSITFQNTGLENTLDADKVFNRFSKSDPSGKGNGLGLAIVKKITELNQWDITYSFTDNLHTFRINF